MQGAIIGGITGGWKGAVFGAAAGAIFGGAFGTGVHLAGRALGAGVYYAASAFAVVQGAADVHTVATTESDEERYTALVGLIFLAGGWLGTRAYFKSNGGSGSFSGGRNPGENAVGQWLADSLGAEIVNGTLGRTPWTSNYRINARGQTSYLEIINGEGGTIGSAIEQLRFSSAGKKILILSREQVSRPGYVEAVEHYAGTGNTPASNSTVMIFADQGNGYIPIRIYTQTNGPRQPGSPPRSLDRSSYSAAPASAPSVDAFADTPAPPGK